jgi:hypothetical protein
VRLLGPKEPSVATLRALEELKENVARDFT